MYKFFLNYRNVIFSFINITMLLFFLNLLYHSLFEVEDINVWLCVIFSVLILLNSFFSSVQIYHTFFVYNCSNNPFIFLNKHLKHNVIINKEYKEFLIPKFKSYKKYYSLIFEDMSHTFNFKDRDSFSRNSNIRFENFEILFEFYNGEIIALKDGFFSDNNKGRLELICNQLPYMQSISMYSKNSSLDENQFAIKINKKNLESVKIKSVKVRNKYKSVLIDLQIIY